jgi:eukaryotic-like serine/threonine-protein kinase
MALTAGAKLGPYEIVGPIGAGGMGEVYRAKDTRLERTVAIKILPAQFSADPVRKQRFEREAKTISSLNHPNICVLYDIGHQDGTDYLVMECVEGETLAKRLEKGPLPLEQVLKYGAQIAAALDKAHRSVVVHRDLKPGNIMLTPSGAKLLDFGLAKPAAPVLSGATLTAATPRAPMTGEGTIVGTFQYMSPEQVEGKELDGRSDIFSLGAVLYEMLTGRRAFEGKSQLSVASAILEKEPAPISDTKPLTPPVLDHVIRKCLAKSADERWQSASDLASELKWISEAGRSSGMHAAVIAHKGRGSWAYALPAVAAVFALAGLLLWRGRNTRDESVVRLTITRPEAEPISVSFGPALALSPDGRRIVFVVAHGANTQLLVRDLSSFDGKLIPGTEGATTPFFSPDGEWLAFMAPGRIKKMPVNGGAAIDVTDVASSIGSTIGGTWLADGTIVFNSGMTAGLVRVPASGGKAEAVSRPDDRKGIDWEWWPEALPGGDVLFTKRSGEGPGESSIAVVSLKTGKCKTVVEKGEYAHYAPGGRIVFLQNGVLLAVPFDERKMEVTGPAEPVLEGVQYMPSSYAQFAIAANGTLAYIPGAANYLNNTLVTIDRSGREEALKAPPRGFEDMDLSPDGKRLAMTVIGGQQWNVWIYDLQQGSLNRLTFEGDNRDPMWSADGKWVIYGSTRNGRRGLYRKPVSGTGGEEQLLDSPRQLFPASVTSDGKYLIYDSGAWEDTAAIYALPLHGERKPQVLLKQRSLANGKVSPSGKWIAYESAESGRTEIYVRRFSAGAEKWQVSTEGGNHALWSRDGGELYFRSSGPKGTMVMSTTIGKGEEFTFSPPRAVFQFGCVEAGAHDYGVMSNGQKIVCIKEPEAETKATQVNVVLNWALELKKK